MIAHGLFPTLITEGVNDDHVAFKQLFINNVHNHMTTDGRSDESTGNVDIHTDTNFTDFFKFVADNVRDYVATMGINPELFDYNLVKSWLNVTKESDNPIHDHADAHVSFSYYVNIPTDVEKFIVFYNPHDTNSLYHGMTNFNVDSFNAFNSQTWSFNPREGTIYVFPGKLKHSVMSNGHAEPVISPEVGSKNSADLMTKRITIAGDFLLTHKEKTSQFLGLQPVKNWRQF